MTRTRTSASICSSGCARRRKAEGLWCLQLKPETGGAGLGKVGMAVCYEAMNRSIFGPVVFNSAAPDDGNMMVLEASAPPAQKERWLQPIVAARCAPPSP